MASNSGMQAPITRPGRNLKPIIYAVIIIIVAIGGVFAYIYLTSKPTVTVQGAGATFPAPLIQAWAATYHGLYSNTTISYNPVGSTAGRQLITNKTVDFGASDAPLSNSQLSAASGLIIFPETLGGVAITYNIQGISNTTVLKFNADVLAGIYNGSITNWSDSRIQSINTVTLPSQAISAVRRSDGSGTTYAFKDFLAHANSWWNRTQTVDTSTTWPSSGPGGPGNSGVAGTVSSTSGSIGYVDVIYAKKNNLGVGAIQNQAGNYVAPTLQGIIWAAANETVVSGTDLRQHIVNARGDQSYPISTYTYIMVYKELSTNGHTTNKDVAFAMARFLWWIVGPDAQSAAPALVYAQLPSVIVSADQSLLRTLTWNGQQIIPS